MANTIIRGGSSTRVIIEPPSLVDVLASIASIQAQIVTIDTKVTAILGGGGVVVPATLGALSLAAASIQEASVAGTVIGGIIGRTTGSTLSLVDAIGNRFALSGTNLVAGTTPLDFEAASTYQVMVRETLAGAANSPRDTLFNITVINVFEVPPLGALSFANAGSLRNGTTATGAIAGATAGSAITASGLPAGFTINGPARTWAFDGTTPAGTTNVTLTETLGDSSNSPRQTVVSVVVTAAQVAPAGPPPAPEISQTSAAGSAPFSWRTVNNSAYSAGMYWHVQRATSPADLNAGTLNGEAIQMIQPQDLAADSPGVVFADLGSTPTGTLALRERVGKDDGSGVLVWGEWSNVLQDTIAATFSGTLDPTHSYKDYTVSADKMSVRAAEYPFRAASRSTVRLTSKTGYFEGLWTDASAAGDSGRIGFSSTLDPSASTSPASPGDGAPGKFVSKEGYSNGAEAFTFNGARTNGQAIGMILYENGSVRRFWVVATEGVYPDVPTFDANQNLTSGSGFTHDQVQPYVFMCPGGGEEMMANFGGSPFQHAAKIPANVNKGIA